MKLYGIISFPKDGTSNGKWIGETNPLGVVAFTHIYYAEERMMKAIKQYPEYNFEIRVYREFIE